MADEVYEDHGHSVAAWTAVVILIFASLTISIGVAYNKQFFTILGVVLVFVGFIDGKVLAKVGFGNKHVHTVSHSPERSARVDRRVS